jgi:hypothetical protein
MQGDAESSKRVHCAPKLFCSVSWICFKIKFRACAISTLSVCQQLKRTVFAACCIVTARLK